MDELDPRLAGGGATGELIRSHDWSSTPLGRIQDWPQSLLTAVAIMLQAKQPVYIGWGPQLNSLYNDGYIPIVGTKHPKGLGQPFSELWVEIWETFEPIVAATLAGEAQMFVDLPIPLAGRPGLDLGYFTFSYTRMYDDDGQVAGFFCAATETTDTVLVDRRRAFILDLDTKLRLISEPDAVLSRAAEALGRHLEAGEVAFAEIDADTELATINCRWGDDSIASNVGVHRLDDFGPGFAADLRAGRRVVISDVRDDPRTNAPASLSAFELIAVRAYMNIPIVKTGRLSGVLAVHCKKPRAWSAEDVLLAQEVADRSWSTLMRVQAEARLRESERSLRDLNQTLEERVLARTVDLERAQEALHHSQKLEALGQLTGGLAHDFNNLMTIIHSSTNLLRRDLSEDRRRRYLDAISDTADRAAKLTAQLLAFARRQPLVPQVFEVGRQVESTVELIRPLVGGGVQIEVRIDDSKPSALADISQFDTALLNFAVNARDAMNGQGRLVFEVKAVDHVPALGLSPPQNGQFVSICVTDSGVGIPEDRLAKIFEPFFTTKDVGKGTGLGLSQAFGFAKQSGGEINVTSTPGKGSSFTLYLPRAAQDSPSEVHDPDSVTPPKHGEESVRGRRILVVEDNADVGDFSTAILHELGYVTRWVASAEDALMLLSESDDVFDLVFTDVVMPGMDGIALATKIRTDHPELPVILTTGYSHALADRGSDGLAVIQKPYSVEALSDALREAFDVRKNDSSGMLARPIHTEDCLGRIGGC